MIALRQALIKPNHALVPPLGHRKAAYDALRVQGYWSRRITSEHRIVYKKTGDQILIAQLRYHYR